MKKTAQNLAAFDREQWRKRLSPFGPKPTRGGPAAVLKAQTPF